jgi:hypothetical protein
VAVRSIACEWRSGGIPKSSSSSTPAIFSTDPAILRKGVPKSGKSTMASNSSIYFRILTQQGPNAPGGMLDYVVKGKMIGGFAVLGYPAEYGNSGVMK